MKILLLLIKVTIHSEGRLGKILEIRPADMPGHEFKWPLLMTAMKVDLTGLEADV